MMRLRGSVATLLVSVAIPAYAVVVPGGAVEAASVDEIFVTARKREERLQDVPVAASVFDEGRLADGGIDTLKELVQLVPGATTADLGASFSNEIIIRGQGSGRHINAETATGIYRNGIFVAGGNTGGRNFNRMDMFDAERIEVLRGPQGALYGHNAIGGAINLISQKPQFDYGVRASASYGDYERVEGTGIVNVPLSDTFAVRGGLHYMNKEDGFFTNTRDDQILDQEDFFGGRLSARWAPTDAVDITLMTEYFEDQGPSFAVGVYNVATGEDPYTSFQNYPSDFHRDEFTTILEADFDLGFATLSSVTLYKRRNAVTYDDLDAFLNTLPDASMFTRFSGDDFERRGQELRLTSAGTGPLTWLVGASYSSTEGTFDLLTNMMTLSVTDTEGTVWAGFGSVGYDLTDRLNLTGELRYTRETKEQTLLFDLNTLDVTAPVVQSGEVTFNNLSPVVTLSWRALDEVTLYGRYATAYRAGGFNSQPDDNAPAPARFSIPYDEEKVISYELGAKTSLFERRVALNLAAFYSETEDLLTVNFVTSVLAPPSRINYVENAGTGKQYGVELDALGRFDIEATGGTLILNGAASWADSEIESNDAQDGLEIPYVYHWQANLSGTYRQPIANSGLTGFAYYGYRGSYGGWQDELDGRTLDDIVLHDARLGVEAKHWSLVGSVENLYDTFYNPQKTSAVSIRASNPRTWKITGTVRF